jgi:starch synthase
VVNILVATSEVAPFAKTGGLADVCGALPIELASLDQDVTVIMPAFRQIYDANIPIEPTGLKFDIPIGGKIVSGQLLKSHLPGSDVPIYFVDQPEYYGRKELYRENGKDYKDNCERFVFFSRAVMEAVRLLDLPVDVMHCNDWQTGLIPAYLEIEYEGVQRFENIATLLTIHNLAYQGHFWHWDMLLTGLDWKYFNWHQMEFFGSLNLLKTGLIFSDALTTVSSQYAREIQSQPLGCGLEGVLQQRGSDLSGIINGVDYTVWNPEVDTMIPAQFNADNWRDGKAVCKAKLQEELGLPVRPDTPVIGLVGRLASQKGWNLVAEVMQKWVHQTDVQWAILGTGEPEYHDLLANLANNWPEKVAAKLTFSNDLAHRIEAGSDMFLMPSEYEPCGLNQMYSLRYGTIPVVRSTGGLADTITDATPQTIGARTANGFSFQAFDAVALEDALTRACAVYRSQPDVWSGLVETAMRQDWSWANSAKQYIALYEQLVAKKKLVAFA